MIKFRRFNLELYDKSKHYVLMKNLSRDEDVCRYVTKDLERWLDEMPEKKEKFVSYAIVRDNKYVGMVGTIDITRDDNVELWCAIKKEERHKKNASEILGELSGYFGKDFSGIKLKINRSNIHSIKSALKNGFVLIDSDSRNKIDTYYYSSDIKNKKR